MSVCLYFTIFLLHTYVQRYPPLRISGAADVQSEPRYIGNYTPCAAYTPFLKSISNAELRELFISKNDYYESTNRIHFSFPTELGI